ncbi:MAG: nucleotide sugar dehydrogenase [Bacillota bacterium]
MKKINQVCICGIGYVGLTLAVTMAEKNFQVTGVEIKPEIVASINSGMPHFHETGLKSLLQKHLHKNFAIFSTIPDKKFDAFIITVGTPLKTGTKEPEFQFVQNVSKEIANHLTDDCLVILRSTVAIGTTRNIVLPILQKKQAQINIAFCPERTIEGKALEELTYLPQIIGGINQESADMAAALFQKITPAIIKVSSPETAEMVKLLDNAYRDLNFAFANEIAQICSFINVDAAEAIQSANTQYPRTKIPSPGYVGGACLEKDPYILISSAKKYNYTPNLIKDAREIHEALPLVVLNRIEQLLKLYGKDIGRAKVFFTGLAFKGDPETDDLRGSPSLIFINALVKLNVENLFAHDFVVPEPMIKNLGLRALSLEEGFHNADVVIIGNNHKRYLDLNINDLALTMKKPAIFYDSWRLFDKKQFDNINGIHYEGLGFKNRLLGESINE